MPGLAQLTTAVSFAALGFSLWLGCYVITQSPRSRLAWQAGLTLWSLGGIFLDILITINPSPLIDWWQGWPILISVAIWYHLSLETLPAEYAKRQRQLLPLIYIYALAFDIISGFTPWVLESSRHGLGVTIKIFTLGPIYFLQPVSYIGLSLLMLYNFWQARQSAHLQIVRKQLDSIVRGSALGVAGLMYGVAVIAFRISAPTLPLVILFGLAIVSVGYGMIRYSALAEGRVLRYDFVFSGVLMATVAFAYFVMLALFDLPVIVRVVVMATVIVTHSGYDFTRHSVARFFVRPREQALRAALHNASTQPSPREGLGDGLRDSLTAIIAAVDAHWGLIALREQEAFVVQASYQSRAVGESLPVDGLNLLELTRLPPAAKDRPLPDLAVIAPLVADTDSLGVILLGPPKSGPSYSERDLDLVAGAADNLAEMMRNVQQQEAHADEIGKMLDTFQAHERQLQDELETLRTPVESAALDSKRFSEVEDALRHLDDYSYLGEHALVVTLLLPEPSTASTHIDRGKALNGALITAIEKLRPTGAEPHELSPREWHPYIVLRDAYVNGHANRDIMSRLYLSEATFHRTRRRALRAVTKALFELTPVV